MGDEKTKKAESKKAKKSVKGMVKDSEILEEVIVKLTNEGNMYQEVVYGGENHMLLEGKSMSLKVNSADLERVVSYFKQELDSVKITIVNGE